MSSSLMVLPIVGALVIILGDTQGLSLIPLVTQMEHDFNLDTTQVSWALAIGGLVSAATVPTLLRLGDMIGMRRILLWSLVFAVIGNAICALAPADTPWLLIGRGVIGVSAVSTPLIYAILRSRSTSETDVDTGSGLLTAAAGVGVALGFLLAGVVIHFEGTTRTVFWITTVLAVFVFAIAYFLIPDNPTRTRIPIDYIGVVLIAIAMSGVSLGVSKGGDWGWTSTSTLVALVGGIAILGAFCIWELRTEHPMVDLRVIVNRRVLPAMIATSLLGGVAIYFCLTVSTYIQTPEMVGYGFSGSVLKASLYLLPISLFVVLGGVFVPRTIGQFGLRNTAIIGAGILAITFFWMSFNHSEPWHYFLGLSLYGIGFGLAYSATYATYLAGARQGEAGLVTGAGALFTFGIASLGPTLFAIILTSRIDVLSVEPLIAVPSANNYNALYWGASLIALAVVVLALVTTKSKFSQELAENTFLKDTVTTSD